MTRPYYGETPEPTGVRSTSVRAIFSTDWRKPYLNDGDPARFRTNLSRCCRTLSYDDPPRVMSDANLGLIYAPHVSASCHRRRSGLRFVDAFLEWATCRRRNAPPVKRGVRFRRRTKQFGRKRPDRSKVRFFPACRATLASCWPPRRKARSQTYRKFVRATDRTSAVLVMEWRRPKSSPVVNCPSASAIPQPVRHQFPQRIFMATRFPGKPGGAEKLTEETRQELDQLSRELVAGTGSLGRTDQPARRSCADAIF